MTTIYDVAKHAGVSVATVSRVLNGLATVDPVLADRVRASIKELGYRRNAVARNLRTSRSSLWAVIVSDVENPFFTSMVRGVEDVASGAGISVVLCNSDENPEKESDYISAALSEQMAGVIISPSGGAVAGVRLLEEGGCPVVLIDRELEGVRSDVVLVDNERGSKAATSHLVTQGYERIACITGPRGLSTAEQRLSGYQAALRESGKAVAKDLIRFSDFREQGGYQAMESLLDGGPRPDAVFATNNLMTVGVMECLVDRGIAVPSQTGVVGFDRIPWADLVRPSITTVAQPTYELGQTAAQLLVDRTEFPDKKQVKVVLETELQIRSSSQRTSSV